MPAWQVVLGLGSNLGDREATLDAAVASLRAVPGVVVLGRSAWIETPPWGLADQPAFLNGAVLIATTLSPFALLAATRAIEADAGRTRVIRWGPRTLDIDLLWTHETVVDHPELQLPHPRLTERVFALGPLLELVPDAADPRTGTPYLASLDSLRKG